MSTETPTFESWAILELFGHKRLAGLVTNVDLFGAAMCRIDIPETSASPTLTQFYSGSAIYGLHPCDEETARAMAEQIAERPIAAWSLRKMAEHAGLLPAPDGDPDNVSTQFERGYEAGYDQGHADAVGSLPDDDDDLQDIPF